jgi:hypothetical protein
MTVLAAAMLAVVGLFNYRIDPYGLYRFDQADSHWLSRIDQFFHLRLTKPWYNVERKPDAVVVGTSRSATIEPRSSAWKDHEGFNLSVPGMRIYELLRFVQHANSVRPLEKLVIGLDFVMMVLPGPVARSGFEEARMAHTASDLYSPPFMVRRIKDIGDTLFSLTGFTRSLSAYSGTAKVDRVYRKDGTWESLPTNLTGQRGVTFIGHEIVSSFSKQELNLDHNMDVLADVLRYAHRHDIDVRLVVTPVHVFVIDLWWRVGYSELWREFHQRLAAVNAAVAEEMGRPPFPLLAFNHLAGVVDEPIHSAKDSENSVFSDGVHFRPRLGNEIMEAAWGQGGSAMVLREQSSVDAYVDAVELLVRDFVAANADEVSRLRRSISPALD